jgi:lysozyme
MRHRLLIGALSISATALITIASNEGYVGETYTDAVGIPTIGFGETKGVKYGQKTDPVRALIQLNASMDEHAKGIANCINVPISQGEYDAYISFAYNVGVNAFCTSTLNKKLNAMDYDGACKELLRWNKAGGRVLNGLTKRREQEYKQCLGL